MKRPLATVVVACTVLAAAAAFPLPAQAQSGTAPSPPAGSNFSPTQLEQIVAPVALYPDSLLMQILMASTYPLEIVDASQWIGVNASLQGAALEEKLKAQDWDPSVKSLCSVPDVLKRMSENLDWTQDMGDAFLGQKTDLLDAAQRMRNLAYNAGNLKTTEQQTVTANPDQTIVIEESDPEVIYVPEYAPTVVYGSAWDYGYWYYPPMYPVVPPGYGLVRFAAGVAIGHAIWGDCNWGWGHSDVDINVDRYNDFNRNTNVNPDRYNLQNKAGDRAGNRATWQHDPQHRQGVNYRSSQVAQKYGGSSAVGGVSRDQARGYARSGAGGGTGVTRSSTAGGSGAGGGTGVSRSSTASGSRAGGGSAWSAPKPSTANRSSFGSGAGSAGNPPSTMDRPSSADRSGSSSYGSSSGSRSGGFSGSSSSSFDRSASSRGASSRGSTSYGGSRGGGGFSGGGSRGGGGGGRR